MALARPALILDNGKVSKPLSKGLLRRYEETAKATAAATGYLADGRGDPAGTGFIVGPKLILTATHVLAQVQRAEAKETHDPQFKIVGKYRDRGLKNKSIDGRTVYQDSKGKSSD